MKYIPLSLFFILTSTFAQSVQRDTLRKTNRLKAIIQKLEIALPSMSYAQLEEVNMKLEGVLLALTGNVINSPYPNIPTRRPLPGRTPYRAAISVTGEIGRQAFSFQVADTMDLAGQCIANFSGMNSADKLKVSVNFSPLEVISLGWGSYAKEGELCARLSEKAGQMGLPLPYASGLISVIGSMDSKSFHFEGHSLHEVLNQCLSFHANHSSNSVSRIIIFAGDQLIQKNLGWGNWNTSTEVCNKIIQEVQ